MSSRTRLAALERRRPDCPPGEWWSVVAYRRGSPPPGEDALPRCPACGEFLGVVVEEVVLDRGGLAEFAAT
jgi:hypothetical protein